MRFFCCVFLKEFDILFINMNYQYKKTLFATLSLITILGYGYFAFAAAPLGGYNPGGTLDPDCAPGDVDCVVTLPSSGSVTADNGLTATGSNVQLGGTLLNNTQIDQDGFKFSTIFTDDGTAFSVPVDYSIENGSSRAIATTGQKMRIGMFSELPLYNLYAGIGFREADQGPSPIMYEETNGLYKAFFFGDQESWVSTYNPTDQTSGSLSARSNEIRLGYDDSLLNISRGILVDTNGVTFSWGNIGNDNYLFPNSRGTSNQVLTTDGAGQLSWQNAGGGSALQLYSENPSLPYTSPVASGLNSVAIGNGARASADDMIVWGKNAGFGSLSSTQSTFLGTNAGYGVVGITSINNTFIGANAGYQTSNVNDSIFIGSNTGYESDNAYFSNFIGQSAGYGADNSDNSNFIGQYAGHSAIGSSNSIFFGFQAGASSLNSSFTTAIGYTSGTFSSSEYSNFFGFNAGASSSADYSNFIGFNAGETTTNASNSIFIGTNSGSNDTVNNTTNPDDFSILLGNNTSTGGFSNSIAIGGFATNTSSNQFMIGSTTRPIDETKIIGSLGTECTITTGTGMACTSDERLKTNIVDLNSDTLTKLQNVRTVSYNWLQNPDSPTQIGFLAQNLEQYFPEMVMTDPTGKKQVYYSQMTPILTKAIQEMNLKITDIGNMETPNTWRDSLIAWFGNVENGITDLYVKTFHADRGEFANEICLGQQGNQTCVTKDQLDQLLLNSGTVIVPNNNEIVIDDNSNPVIDPAIDESFDNNQETPVVDSVGESESENTEVTE